MVFYVTEIQTTPGGACGAITTAYDSQTLGGVDEARRAADAKFHTILAAAAMSDVPVHSAIVYTDEAMFVRGEAFTHE